ncbi:hypothetical protein PO124_04865 [Bacillus licheniformis]|nr:hypothetical protein [Bacillus licheniformis]
MWMGVAPVVMALGTAALIVAEYTPVSNGLDCRSFLFSSCCRFLKPLRPHKRLSSGLPTCSCRPCSEAALKVK